MARSAWTSQARVAALTTIAAGALLIGTNITATTQAPDTAAALSGGWKLNEDASVNPNGPGGRGAAARGGGGGRGGGMSGPPPGGDLGREEMQRFNAHLALFRQAPALLGIQATAKDVLLIHDPDPARGLIYKHTTDNKKSTLPTAAGPIDIRVKWDGKTLRREIETKETLKVIEEYTPSADGKQLVVTVKTSSTMVRMPPVEITRVYDRVQ